MTATALAAVGSNANENGTLLISGTAVSASGTSVDFTGIPSWAKRITVMFNGVSTNGSSNILVQIGDSGGIETTGYSSAMCYAVNASASVGSSSTAGFLSAIVAAVTVTAGHVLITNVSGNAWVYSAFCGQTNTTTAGVAGGTKTLSDTLTQVRITTVNGTDTFDAGTINLMWE